MPLQRWGQGETLLSGEHPRLHQQQKKRKQ